MLEGRRKGRWKGFQRWKGLLKGCQKGARRGSSAGRVRWKGPLEGVPARGGGFQQGSSRGFQRRKGFQQGFWKGFQQVSYHPFHLHFVLFQATVDVWRQVVQPDESVAEPQARGNGAVSVVDSVSVAWQAREVLTWPTSAATKPGAVAELMFQFGQTPWYKVIVAHIGH